MDVSNILIRVDGSNDIGLGHLMRCLTFSKYLRTKNINSFYVTKTKDVSTLVRDSDFDCIYLEQHDEIEQLLGISLRYNTKKIIVDLDYNRAFSSNEVYCHYIKKLKKEQFFVISFGDEWSPETKSNITIIPYLEAEKKKCNQKHTRYLLGVKYFILRSEFLNKLNFTVRKDVKNVLITMGGGDPEGISLKVVDAIFNMNLMVEVTLVLGMLMQISDREIIALQNKNVHVVYNTHNISKLMMDCDIAITNSGLTKYELSALGVPYIVISDNIHQCELMQKFSDRYIAIHAGMNSKIDKDEISHHISDLSCSYHKRVKLSENGKKFIDGKGAERLYHEIF